MYMVVLLVQEVIVEILHCDHTVEGIYFTFLLMCRDHLVCGDLKDTKGQLESAYVIWKFL